MSRIEAVRNSDNVCPVCMAADISVFLEIPQVPVHCNLLWPTSEEAKSAPRGDICLGYCQACGHIFNLAFEPGLMQYTQAYENSLHFSPRFQKYATSLAERLVTRYALRGKEIIEIGCGKGDFLRLLCDLGGNHGVGFDPSYVPDKADATSGRVTFIQDLYDGNYSSIKADFICCRHVLEHLHNPIEFLAMIREGTDGRRKTVLFFEVPNMLYTLRDASIWDLIYEHCSYFSARSLASAFTLSGFEICGLSEEFGGQFLSIEALPLSSNGNPTEQPTNNLDDMAALISNFADKYREKLGGWEHDLRQIAHRGQRAAVWGAGSKGVSFLNMVANSEQVEYVVDINPRKQGMYIAGHGAKIVPPAYLQAHPPDVVLVMNSIYVAEIQELTMSLGLSPEIICA